MQLKDMIVVLLSVSLFPCVLLSLSNTRKSTKKNQTYSIMHSLFEYDALDCGKILNYATSLNF